MLNTILTDVEGGYLYVRADGELTSEDSDSFAPALARLVQSRAEPLPVLVELGPSFDLESAKARWQQARPDQLHLKRLGRVALVGDADQQTWATQAAEFLRGNVELRFFEHAKRANAEQWLLGQPLTELP